MDSSIASVGSDIAEMSLDELRAEVQRARTEVVGRAAAASPGPSTIEPVHMVGSNQPLTPPPHHVLSSRASNTRINPRVSATGHANAQSPPSAQHQLSPPPARPRPSSPQQERTIQDVTDDMPQIVGALKSATLLDGIFDTHLAVDGDDAGAADLNADASKLWERQNGFRRTASLPGAATSTRRGPADNSSERNDSWARPLVEFGAGWDGAWDVADDTELGIFGANDSATAMRFQDSAMDRGLAISSALLSPDRTATFSPSHMATQTSRARLHRRTRARKSPAPRRRGFGSSTSRFGRTHQDQRKADRGHRRARLRRRLRVARAELEQLRALTGAQAQRDNQNARRAVAASIRARWEADRDATLTELRRAGARSRQRQLAQLRVRFEQSVERAAADVASELAEAHQEGVAALTIAAEHALQRAILQEQRAAQSADARAEENLRAAFALETEKLLQEQHDTCVARRQQAMVKVRDELAAQCAKARSDARQEAEQAIDRQIQAQQKKYEIDIEQVRKQAVLEAQEAGGLSLAEQRKSFEAALEEARKEAQSAALVSRDAAVEKMKMEVKQHNADALKAMEQANDVALEEAFAEVHAQARKDRAEEAHRLLEERESEIARCRLEAAEAAEAESQETLLTLRSALQHGAERALQDLRVQLTEQRKAREDSVREECEAQAKAARDEVLSELKEAEEQAIARVKREVMAQRQPELDDLKLAAQDARNAAVSKAKAAAKLEADQAVSQAISDAERQGAEDLETLRAELQAERASAVEQAKGDAAQRQQEAMDALRANALRDAHETLEATRARFEAALAAALRGAKSELDSAMTSNATERQRAESRLSLNTADVMDNDCVQKMNACLAKVDKGLSSDSDSDDDNTSGLALRSALGLRRKRDERHDSTRVYDRSLAVRELRASIRVVAGQFDSLRHKHAVTLERMASLANELIQCRRALAEKEDELECLTRNGDPREHERTAKKLFQANQQLLQRLAKTT